MSQENLEIVTRLSEHLRASYAGGAATDGLLAFCAPDIRIDASRRVFNPDVYEGAAGLQRMIGDICDAWEGFEETSERLIDAGDRVLALQTIAGRGRSSGVEVRASGALVLAIREGRVQSVEIFSEQRDAIEALGLPDDVAVGLSAEQP